jgi:gluconokinase
VAGAPVIFLFLGGRRETLPSRMSARPGHFMPTTLLDSQLAMLEPPAPDEPHLLADIEQTPDAIVALFQAGVKTMLK